MKMKGTFKKILSFVLATAAVCPMLVSCGGNNDTNSGGKATLKIRVANTGFGTACIEAVAKEFARIENCNVKVESTVIMEQDLNKLIADYQMEDIFCVSGTYKSTDVIRAGKFVQIDDVWNAIPDGEDTPIKDKTFETFRDDSYLNDDGHYYSIPYETQLGGFAYNKDTLDLVYGEGNWTLPKTSDELTSMAQYVTDQGQWGMTFTTSQPYWTMAVNGWALQYHGWEEYNKLIAGYYQKEDGTWEFSQNGECLDQSVGYLRINEAVYPLVHKQYAEDGKTYTGIASTYCDVMDFMQMQVSFAGLGYKPADYRKVAFTPTGAWLNQENGEDFAYAGTTPGFFNVVMSAVVEKLSFYEEKGTDYYTLSETKRASYDQALSELIDYADQVNDGKNPAKPTTANGYTVTDADIEKVQEARSVRYINNQPHMAITHNSKNIELAKKFLIFYASDYAGEIYSANTHGVTPFSYNKRVIDESTSLYDAEVSKLLSGKVTVLPSATRKPYGQITMLNIEGQFYDCSDTRYNLPASSFNYLVTSSKAQWATIVRKSGNADKLIG